LNKNFYVKSKTVSFSKLLLLSFLIVLFILTVFLLSAKQIQAGVIEGIVLDFDSNEPIPVVSIRVEGTGKSMATNDDGRYRLRLDNGIYQLKFSHVAHYSETIEVTITDEKFLYKIHLAYSYSPELVSM